MEPANCRVEGRAAERERGTLQVLEPGATYEVDLEFGVLDGPDEIRAFDQKVDSLLGK